MTVHLIDDEWEPTANLRVVIDAESPLSQLSPHDKSHRTPRSLLQREWRKGYNQREWRTVTRVLVSAAEYDTESAKDEGGKL